MLSLFLWCGQLARVPEGSDRQGERRRRGTWPSGQEGPHVDNWWLHRKAPVCLLSWACILCPKLIYQTQTFKWLAPFTVASSGSPPLSQQSSHHLRYFQNSRNCLQRHKVKSALFNATHTHTYTHTHIHTRSSDRHTQLAHPEGSSGLALDSFPIFPLPCPTSHGEGLPVTQW